MASSTSSQRQPIAVVGAGVIGLATAYYLRRAGADVVVLERAHPGAGASYGNAGWVTPSLSSPLPDPTVVGVALRSVVDRRSPLYVQPWQAVRLLPWLSAFLRHCTSREQERGLLATLRLGEPTMRCYDELAADGVAFEMAERGVTFVALSAVKAEAVRASMVGLRDFGYAVPESISDASAMQARDPSLRDAVQGGFHLAGERSVQPMTVVTGLTARLRELGADVRTGDAVVDFEAERGTVRAVRTTSGRQPVAAVVIAAGVWSRELARRLGIRLPVIAGKGYSALVRPGVVPRAPLYLIEAKVGVTPYGDLMRVAGTMELSGLNARFDERRLQNVLGSASRYLRRWQPGDVSDRWVGMRPMTPDGLPVLGPAPGWANVHIATGHAMQGVTLAPATGMLVAETMLSGAIPDVLRPFLPERFARVR